MAKKIIRGTLVGAFLGIVGGLALSYALLLVKTVRRSNDISSGSISGTPYIEVMSPAVQISGGQSTGQAEIQLPGNDMYTLYDGLPEQVSIDIMPDQCARGVDVDYNPPECQDLQDVVLRFHVRANSNEEEDILLKYEVRDAVLKQIAEDLSEDCTRDQVLAYMKEHMDQMEKTAAKVVKKAGYDYSIRVYLTNDYFPIRQYGEMVLPAGNYQALRIDIGAAEGENFWCILYPMMCYTLDSGAVVSHADEERLSEELSEEDYRKLFVDCDTEDNKVKVRFKLLEMLGL